MSSTKSLYGDHFSQANLPIRHMESHSNCSDHQGEPLHFAKTGELPFFSRLGVLMYRVIKGVCRSFFQEEGRISFQKIQFLVSFTSLCGNKPSVVVLRFSTFRYNQRETLKISWRPPRHSEDSWIRYGAFFQTQGTPSQMVQLSCSPLFPASRIALSVWFPRVNEDPMGSSYSSSIYPPSIHFGCHLLDLPWGDKHYTKFTLFWVS